MHLACHTGVERIAVVIKWWGRVLARTYVVVLDVERIDVVIGGRGRALATTAVTAHAAAETAATARDAEQKDTEALQQTNTQKRKSKQTWQLKHGAIERAVWW